MADNVSDFKELVRDIESKKILLPDFQRDFVWKDEEKQKKIGHRFVDVLFCVCVVYFSNFSNASLLTRQSFPIRMAGSSPECTSR